jgi:hypothetical protein
MNNIIKFPYAACRRIHSKKPRRSKNGTAEERAAKAASLEAPADVVLMTNVREQARSKVDGRKLRVSPLRNSLAAISSGATVFGKMHTAGLKGQPLAAFPSGTREEWLETLRCAIGAVETMGMGLVEARHTLKELQAEQQIADVGQLAADKSRVADDGISRRTVEPPEIQAARREIERLFHQLDPKLKPVALTWLRHLATEGSA